VRYESVKLALSRLLPCFSRNIPEILTGGISGAEEIAELKFFLLICDFIKPKK
jgi:hypothetical protein